MRLWDVTRGLVELSRPLNVLLTVPVVWLGAALVAAEGRPPLLATALACLVVACALGAGNTFNDWADQVEDRINRPDRPLPSGRLSPEIALAWAGVQAVNSLLLAWKLMELSQKPELFRICLLCLLLLFHYGLRGKGLAFWGNLEVAALGALAVLYGALALPGFPGEGQVWWLAAFSGLLTLQREGLKDLQDMAGDRAAGRHTAALRLGEQGMARLLRATSLGPLLLALLLIRERPLTGLCLLLPVCWVLGASWKATSRRAGLRQGQVKAAMLLGLLLFWLCEAGPLAPTPRVPTGQAAPAVRV